MPDLRIVTGPCLLIVGVVLIVLALRLWFVHPVNRVLRIGPYVTEAGLRAIMRLRPLLLGMGCYFVTAGFARLAFWAWRADLLDRSIALLFGTAEAAFALWTATLLGMGAWRLWK